MQSNRSEHLRYRYGICLNDSCSKCKSKEVQQIAARKDFVCEECQKALRECPPPKSGWDKYKKLIIGAAAVVVAAAVAVPVVLNMNKPVDDLKLRGPITQLEDTTAVTTDSVADVVEQVQEEGTAAAEEQTAPPTAAATGSPAPQPAQPAAPSIRVPYGTYSGPTDGLNGTITVTKSYSLDLRNASHETIELLPGDVITRTQFRNGELVSGYWQRGGERRSFNR